MKFRLLPYPWKYAGLLLTLAGTTLAVLYLWLDLRIKLPVFAVFSSFLETKMLVSFRTNITDELVMILLIAGTGLLVFSQEKNEAEHLPALRFRAMTKALISNNILLLFSVVFIYGSGFLGILVINMISLSLFYLMYFYLLKRKKQITDNS